MYRISVTTLEKFRRFMSEASPYDTEESLIASLSGEFKGNAKTFYGTGFHAIVEGDYKMENDHVLASGIMFTPEQAAPAFDYRNAHPLMVHEMALQQVYETNRFPIQVGGRVDGIEGAVIRDLKTKYRSPTVLEYQNSFQWRFYLDIMDLDLFYFDLFEVRKFNEFNIESEGPHFLPDAVIEAYPEIPCLRYERMHDDCLSLLNEFLDYIDTRNFYHYLKPAKGEILFP